MVQNIWEFISSEQFIKTTLSVLGGLGIFLYGISIMGDSLKTLAGDKLKNTIEKLTNNVFMGIFLGIIVTAVLQSSSGTTALSISLIRAGLMTMPQAIGIIMGANIGTTVTAFLFSVPKISEFSLFFIGIGAILIFFFRNKKTNNIGKAILGFGLLFYGMDLMGGVLKDLSGTDMFKNLLFKFSENPVFGVLAGAVATMIVQSSSATTGIVQSLFESSGLTLKGALPILFGNNIGTTVTAVIAAIGGSLAAKRASAFHVFFNILGALLFLILLSPFYILIDKIAGITDATPKLTIAYAHLIFNVINTIIFVWFVKHIVWLINKIIPGKDDLEEDFNLDVFNERMITESPILALESTKNVILHMGKIVKKMVDLTFIYSKEANAKVLEEALQLENIINSLDHKIHDHLIKITSKIDEGHSKVLSKYLDTIRDLERIGDHCENILQICEHVHDNKGYLTIDAWDDLNLMFNTVTSMLSSCLIIIDKSDKNLASKVIEIEDSVDRLEKKARKRHTIRVNEGICTSEMGIFFVEILSNLERIGDHCENISEYTLNDEYYVIIDEPEAGLRNKNDRININIQPYKNNNK